MADETLAAGLRAVASAGQILFGHQKGVTSASNRMIVRNSLIKPKRIEKLALISIEPRPSLYSRGVN
jgi:hypothetical protein